MSVNNLTIFLFIFCFDDLFEHKDRDSSYAGKTALISVQDRLQFAYRYKILPLVDLHFKGKRSHKIKQREPDQQKDAIGNKHEHP
ncbi:hypothetical protein D3C87_689720 [compost metagenome]